MREEVSAQACVDQEVARWQERLVARQELHRQLLADWAAEHSLQEQLGQRGRSLWEGASTLEALVLELEGLCGAGERRWVPSPSVASAVALPVAGF